MKLADLKHMIRRELAASIKSIAQEKQMMKEKTVNPWKPPREMTPAEIKERDRIGKQMLKDPNAVKSAKGMAQDAGEPQEWESYLWAMATSQAIEDSDAAYQRGQDRAARKSKNAQLNKKGDVPSWQKQKDKRAAAKQDKSEPAPAETEPTKEPEKALEPPKEEPKSDTPAAPKKKRPPMKISGKKLKKAVVKKKLTKKKAPTKAKKKVDPKLAAKAKKISKVRKITGKKKQKAETVILTSETQA